MVLGIVQVRNAHHVFKDLQRSVQLTILAIGRDEGCVGCGSRVSPRPQHALIYFQGFRRLSTHIACNDDGVVGPDLWLNALPSNKADVVSRVRMLISSGILLCNVMQMQQ